ncbi:hypothetical protein [Photobacterium kishitanii]|uniref:hypothetical protein n=1 Tax=Photobacterium kishitanii TaxID=318456 RepID=UPI0027385E72|nr:hypothetical protein [Photobacterium kishitanii]
MAVYSFSDKNDPSYNACTDIHSNRMSLYISGYERATELLLANVLDNRNNLDSLVYPIMYNYRHYLELSFKELIWLCKQLTQAQKEFTAVTGNDLKFVKYRNDEHSLGKCWNKVLVGLREVEPELPSKLISQISKVVEEFNNLDKSGQSFRYPENRNWQDTLSDKRYINLVSVAKSFNQTRPQIDQLFSWLLSMQERIYENPVK